MSAIDGFVERHGPGARPIGDIVETWEHRRAAKDLADAVVVGGAMAADLIQGDGFRDQVPEAVRDAVANLAREPKSWEAYDAARCAIQETLAKGKESIDGWVNKYKGQLGEDLFAQRLGGNARLASSGSQAGYDVIHDTGNGPEYIQVKLYSDPSQIIEHMKKVQQRVLNGEILDEDSGLPVRSINWAVPHDIADDVRQGVQATPELANVTVYSVGITADEAEGVIRSGIDAVGAEGLERFSDFFGDLAGGVATAVALQAAFVGFLWWKGQREAEEARDQIGDTVFTSAAGFGVALAAEEIADSLLFGGPLGFALGFTARQIVRRALSSRRAFVKHNAAVNGDLDALITRLASC